MLINQRQAVIAGDGQFFAIMGKSQGLDARVCQGDFPHQAPTIRVQ
jgi:hypothetical protein